MKAEKEYTPFGEQWVAEMSKMKKIFLINMLRKELIKNQELEIKTKKQLSIPLINKK